MVLQKVGSCLLAGLRVSFFGSLYRETQVEPPLWGGSPPKQGPACLLSQPQEHVAILPASGGLLQSKGGVAHRKQCPGCLVAKGGALGAVVNQNRNKLEFTGEGKKPSSQSALPAILRCDSVGWLKIPKHE